MQDQYIIDKNILIRFRDKYKYLSPHLLAYFVNMVIFIMANNPKRAQYLVSDLKTSLSETDYKKLLRFIETCETCETCETPFAVKNKALEVFLNSDSEYNS